MDPNALADYIGKQILWVTSTILFIGGLIGFLIGKFL